MAVDIIDGIGSNFKVKVTSANQLSVIDSVANSLVPSAYDYISLSYY